MSSCMYTTQGDLICNKTSVQEQFIAEKPNGPVSSEGNAIIDTAIGQKYCDINVVSDAKSGKTSYSFRKECESKQ